MRNTAQVDKVFLATTALEEFWDITKPIVFLGEWCLLYERRSHWEALDSQLLGSPYNNVDSAENAYCYVNSIYEQLLPIIGAALNSIHGTSNSVRYWRILIGPWLQSYLSAVYDRLVHIKHALEQYPDLTTIGLSEESFVVPTDTLDFACYLSEDSYNLQLYTKIFSALNLHFPRIKAEVPRNLLYGKFIGNSWVVEASCYAAKVFSGMCAKSSKKILLRNSYFSKKIELQLLARNPGKILTNWSQISPCAQIECDIEKRKVLRDIEIGKSDFDQCLSAMLFSDMPQCFIEGFYTVKDKVYKNYPKHIHAIHSANGWYCDELFKQWAAMSAEEGALLVGTQHGGNYGVLKFMPSENLETAIVDYYYSWGWERTDCMAKVIPMPATKLTGRKEIGADNSKSGILWGATSAARYVTQLPFLPMHFQEYLEWQIRFVQVLPPEVMAQIRFRSHYENYSWGTIQRMKDCAPYIRIESWDVPFKNSLNNCRLYVCDHLSTTFSEALAANKPTVLFCNPDANRLRGEAQPYFDLLRAGGMLFDTPEAAAAVVAAVYDDVESWWNVSARQKAVRTFCEKFAQTSPDAVTLWGDEFKRISEISILN